MILKEVNYFSEIIFQSNQKYFLLHQTLKNTKKLFYTQTNKS
jgi:hypothetical protein